MRKTLFTLLLAGLTLTSYAQTATLRIDTLTKHQHITGFGAFVCSPQFSYNHMTTTEIERVWKTGPGYVGCNIMRLYIPIGESAWSQSLATAKKAKALGLILFASPWGQPTQWKTNGTINAKDEDGTLGYLKRENWADYAAYLEGYVQYLRSNGVELDAISIQNEPDWTATYAGCLWSASEIAEFVKTYGRTISCKIMAPETLAVSDAYVNALNKTDVLDCFDIYGGHQYGGIGTAYKNLAKKGKEIWMTEYLINWNEGQSTQRNWDFQKDFFNFFKSINDCMLGDFNAWIHYAAKRYYGLLGDGTMNAGSTGAITKRGRIMSHFARFVTGYTRVDGVLGGSNLSGSFYLSPSGDTVVAVVANQNKQAVPLKLDLPFYATGGTHYFTNEVSNMATQTVEKTETCRPVVTLPVQSVNTLMFVRSRDRQPSDMKGSVKYFTRTLINDLTTTSSSFGTTYKMSNATRTFDHENPLISSRTNASSGYVKLDKTYSQLVFDVKRLSSTLNYSSAITTLIYVNSQGNVSSHNYGDLNFNSLENFSWVFDLSKTTLPDGCKGLISITNNNWSSKLTFNFGDVYLSAGDSPEYAGTLSGDYVADDSYVIDFSTDAGCTSIDMTAVTAQPETLPWMEGTNKVVFTTADSPLTGTNVVKDGTCATLAINEAYGTFHPATKFTATNATYTCEVNGAHIVTLPFQAALPEGAAVYQLTDELKPVAIDVAPAGVPLLIEAKGQVVFQGSGEVAWTEATVTDDALSGILLPSGIQVQTATGAPAATFNLLGQKVQAGKHGFVIRSGKKYYNR